MVTFAVMIGIEGSGRAKFARERLAEEKRYVLVSSDDIGREFQTDGARKKLVDEAVDVEYDPRVQYYHLTLPLIGKDALRETILSEMVLEEVLRCIRENLQTGRDVVWDGTNLHSENRKQRISLARQWGASKVVCYWMKIKPYRCAANLANILVPIGKSPAQIGVDLKSLTLMVYQRHAMLEPPTQDEGFNEIVEVTEDRFGMITE